MADFSSTITVKNGYSSSPLSRISYRASQGSWITPPRSEVGPAESDVFKLGASNNVSEGEATYRTTSGAQFKVYFRCGSNGNTVAVTPPQFASAQFNASGTPLAGTTQVLEN
ncbi:hypothetical protein PsYK624_160000 [Phanerochaete sordida]|uniref:Uncharacterized protein n=1 Tax=Phanerochaete sordida TaxID=48140 RepID=A0A9P3LMI3_9APHY|nr:hypothetical protein PsYK624_160000 [Phanerochaete sordida]